MNNTRDDILHLAKLSNLQLTDAEISALQQDVTNIVGYISQLDELDTTGKMFGVLMKLSLRMLPASNFSLLRLIKLKI